MSDSLTKLDHCIGKRMQHHCIYTVPWKMIKVPLHTTGTSLNSLGRSISGILESTPSSEIIGSDLWLGVKLVPKISSTWSRSILVVPVPCARFWESAVLSSLMFVGSVDGILPLKLSFDGKRFLSLVSLLITNY